MGFFSKNVTGADAVRPVNEQATGAIEQALGVYGPVLHAMDPNRGVSVAAGGPPVWSVGIVNVPGEKPYTLLMTYGLSYAVSPEPARSHVRYELSLAVPASDQATPWGDAFLRAQAFYVVSQKAELRLGECVPFRGIPITKMAYAPEFQAQMPDSSMVGMLVAKDPVIPTIRTMTGEIEVRRLVGIDQMEIDRSVTWDPAAMLEMIRGLDPLLLTPLKRPPWIPQLAAKIQPLADRDGSSVEGVLLEMQWRQQQQQITIDLPQGPAAWRATEALKGRVGHNRKLMAFSTVSPPIAFIPGTPGTDVTPNGLELSGSLTTPPISLVMDALAAGAGSIQLVLQGPPPAKQRLQFFAKIADTVKKYELDAVKLGKELHKLVPEAQQVGPIEVADAERDADRAALASAQRTLRFTRVTDQSAIDAILAAIAR